VRPELPEPLARPRVLLAGDPSARPAGLERALTRAGFQLVERQESSVDPEADAVLITLNEIDERALDGLLPPPNTAPALAPPRIVIFAAADRDAPATALSLGAADALAAPVHLPELCARLHTRIRDRLEAERAPHEQQLREAAEAFVQPGLHPDELALALVRRLARTFDLAHCSFASIAPDGETIRVVAEVQRPEPGEEYLELSRHPEIAEAIRTRRTVVRPVHAGQSAGAPRTVIVLPVETRDRVAGTLLLGTSEAQRRLSPVQLEFAAGLARAAAVALEEGRPGALNGSEPGEHSAPLPHADDALEALDRRMREEFERARRYSLSFSLILLGVDELRSVREQLGPEAADRLKRDVAEVLRRELRVPDFVVSYGTSEFAIVLPETGPAGARRSVIRVRERLSLVPSDGDPRLEHPRFSAGIVTYPHPAVSQSDELYAMAEAALMRGKAQSGERIGVAV
jgi:diguanylate cyclase (GGDEF)-like protein